MKSSFNFYLNYDICCCARFIIKTNTISSCKKIKNSKVQKNGD